jgi:hypothetical protein
MTTPRSTFLHSVSQPLPKSPPAIGSRPPLATARTHLNFDASIFFHPPIPPRSSAIFYDPFMEPRQTFESAFPKPVFHVPGMPMPAVPDFGHIDAKEELDFHPLSSIVFADSRDHYDLDKEIVWHEEALEHIYTIEQFDLLAETDLQYASAEFLRFVLPVDMQILLAHEGLPRPNIPSHVQMAQGNAFSLASGLLKRKMIGDVLWIEGADNHSGGFKGSFQNLQFLFIQLLKSAAYRHGKIRLSPELMFRDVTISSDIKTYFCSKDKLIDMIERLTQSYETTLLSAEMLAEYSKKVERVDYPVVPKNMSAKEYKWKRDADDEVNVTPYSQPTLARSTSSPLKPPATPVKRRPANLQYSPLSRSAEKVKPIATDLGNSRLTISSMFAHYAPAMPPVKVDMEEEKMKPPKMQKRS